MKIYIIVAIVLIAIAAEWYIAWPLMESTLNFQIKSNYHGFDIEKKSKGSIYDFCSQFEDVTECVREMRN